MSAINGWLENRELSIHYEDPLSFTRIENTVHAFLRTMNPDYSREVVFVCIGTDRATGDCLGPLVGTRLLALNRSLNVYGTLEQPAHATNMSGVLADLDQSYHQPLIVAIDACLGSYERVGFITIKKGSLKPGTALKKSLPEVGDFYVSGVVNVGGFLEHMVLQNTRLHVVYRMADTIARGLYMAQSRYDYWGRRQAAGDSCR